VPPHKLANLPNTNINLREYKTLRQTFTNNFYMRKIQKDKRHNHSCLECPSPNQTLDFMDILSD
jgi:hypothetical protein